MENERLLSVSLIVKDLEATTTFYRDVLGLQVLDSDDPLIEHSWINADHVEVVWREGAILRLALVQADDTHPASCGNDLSFVVDDVEAMHERLVAQGVPVLHEPRPWNELGGRIARYFDPDGNSVGFLKMSEG